MIFVGSRRLVGQVSALKDLMKLNELANADIGKIRSIWNVYHAAHPQYTSLVLGDKQYQLFKQRAQKQQFFVFPIIRKQKAFWLVSQSEGNYSDFCYSDNYSVQSYNPRRYFTIYCYEDIMQAKGIVLVRGEIQDQLISKSEAEAIFWGFFAHYCEDYLFEEYIEKFNMYPEKFDEERYIDNFISRFLFNNSE